MNIGAIARVSGLTTEAIRYYEGIGLLPAAKRGANGYRVYSGVDIARLIFLRQARKVGFTIDQCRQLRNLYENPRRKSATVHALVANKLVEVEQHIHELENMRRVLSELISACSNDEQAGCAIIDSLAGSAASDHLGKAKT
ncbi:MAG TPA: Cu(I)-responsive transcriptional regulator [Porticoccaceae bacterium]|nr:Cu(I)-responsive transcriptional regulator [Porticoccaceae bacterium]HCO61149.1 Cu(I)-responsive transcriptional regulator [Porticoccaceae bacterium]